MNISETLKFLREFPSEILANHVKKGDYNLDALFLSYDKDETVRKFMRLGLGDYSIEDAQVKLKNMIAEYIIEMNVIYEHLTPVDLRESDENTPKKKREEISDYKELIIIIRRLAEIGNFNLDNLTLFDAHNIIALDFPEVKSIERLKEEVFEKINVENENIKARRQHIWDTCSEEDQNNRAFLIHFINSEDI
jgi:hypothetical protein